MVYLLVMHTQSCVRTGQLSHETCVHMSSINLTCTVEGPLHVCIYSLILYISPMFGDDTIIQKFFVSNLETT